LPPGRAYETGLFCSMKPFDWGKHLVLHILTFFHIGMILSSFPHFPCSNRLLIKLFLGFIDKRNWTTWKGPDHLIEQKKFEIAEDGIAQPYLSKGLTVIGSSPRHALLSTRGCEDFVFIWELHRRIYFRKLPLNPPWERKNRASNN
jgi:hypothetical protein